MTGALQPRILVKPFPQPNLNIGSGALSPEMHSLEADLALIHALEPALLLLLGAISALPSTAAALVEVLAEGLLAESLASGLGDGSLTEERARGAEEGVCGGGHGHC